MADDQQWEVNQAVDDRLVLQLDSFEGPIDLLLTLAREQKVDLARIRIVPLVEQYLAFIQQARRMRLELAADYLVMAAWLAYLKSRLLLPDPQPEAEPSATELADHLAFQLRRLEAMQRAGAALLERPRLGRDRFPRGAEERFEPTAGEVTYDVTLYDLLRAYGQLRSRGEPARLTIAATRLYAVEDALERLRERIGAVPEWTDLARFLPTAISDAMVARSALASHFAACLELARDGFIDVRQIQAFGAIELRTRRQEPLP
ncbi:MAG: segregation/condensation protein A [Alphaproteobacteria bacterium]|nr:ScpA family protein [Alphaproteobacteria bacterium]TAD88453.1 MAG: segregation/condensation protein A [Alphaproteobacteria bacterium]